MKGHGSWGQRLIIQHFRHIYEGLDLYTCSAPVDSTFHTSHCTTTTTLEECFCCSPQLQEDKANAGCCAGFHYFSITHDGISWLYLYIRSQIPRRFVTDTLLVMDSNTRSLTDTEVGSVSVASPRTRNLTLELKSLSTNDPKLFNQSSTTTTQRTPSNTPENFGPASRSSMLESLPTELKLAILEHIPDVQTLVALVHASPILYRLCSDDRERYLTRCALRDLRSRSERINPTKPTSFWYLHMKPLRIHNISRDLKPAIDSCCAQVQAHRFDQIKLTVPQCFALQDIESISRWRVGNPGPNDCNPNDDPASSYSGRCSDRRGRRSFGMPEDWPSVFTPMTCLSLDCERSSTQ